MNVKMQMKRVASRKREFANKNTQFSKNAGSLESPGERTC